MSLQIHALNPEHFPAIAIPGPFETRAISRCENMGWRRMPGFPEGAPENTLCDFAHAPDADEGKDAPPWRALLCGPCEDHPDNYLLFRYQLIESVEIVH